MYYIKLYSILGVVVLLSSSLAAVGIKYTFINETPYDVAFKGTFASGHNCLSSDFVINLYPRGSQAMERPCMVTSFDVTIKRDGKQIQIGSYHNSRSDCRDKSWKLQQIVTGGRSQFHIRTD